MPASLPKCWFIAVAALLATTASANSLTITTPRGASLAAIADYPTSGAPAPAVVLAPGQGYHMAQPAMQEAARALVAAGFVVYRFNWAYFTAPQRGRPSEDLALELEDLLAVVAAARRDPRVVAKNVSVGGKSLGSVVAWRAFVGDASLRAGLFLTPVCSRVPKGETVPKSQAPQHYPGLDAERRPMLFVTGHADPLCAAPVLYRFASENARARVAIVGGNHGYELTSAPAAAQRMNLDAVAGLVAAFAAEVATEATESSPTR